MSYSCINFTSKYESWIIYFCMWGHVIITWWRYQMETFSALLAFCAGNSPVPGEFPSQRPATRSFDVSFDLCLNKQLSKQSRRWWFETPSHPLLRHNNEFQVVIPPWSAPSHYLNQCWNIVNWTIGNKLQWNFNRNWYIFIQENAFQSVVWEMSAILSRGRWLNCLLCCIMVISRYKVS